MSLYSVEANKISVYYPLLLVLTILAKVYSWIALLSGSLKTKWRIDIRVDISLIFQMNFYIISIGYVHCIIIYLITPYLCHFCTIITRQKFVKYSLYKCVAKYSMSVSYEDTWGWNIFPTYRLFKLTHIRSTELTAITVLLMGRIFSFLC